MAAKVIDAADGYQLGPVLSKPILTQKPQSVTENELSEISEL